VKPRGLAQNSALALAGDLAAKAGLLAVMMVAARGLRTAEFAAFAAATALATVLTAVLDGGSQILLTRDGVAGAGTRRGLLRALAVARLPLLALALTTAAVIGVASGRLVLALATVLLAAAGAAQQSLTGALRSAQDLRPEALAKLATGVLAVAAGGFCVAVDPRADVAVLALAVSLLLGLVPLSAALRRTLAPARTPGPPPAAPGSPWTALRRAAPLGMMTLATLAYYRSGTIVLSVVSSPAQTARFATASTLAWGMLSVANAVTTGLLPRLAATATAAERDALTWRVMRWVAGFSLVAAGLVAAFARPLLTIAFGARYAGAALPLMLLAASTVLIAPAGVLGTALVAQGRLRPIAVQVAASLLINLVVLVVLGPALGAAGAAIATLACEAAGLVLMLRAVRPARIHRTPVPFAAGQLARGSR
jgi:O-antigen/teichoic acid export membrane protein